MWFLCDCDASRRLVVTTGVGGGGGVKATEVLDFSNSNLTKPSFGVIPETRWDAVGAYLNDQPIICGGDDGDYRNAYDTCLTFHKSRWSQTHILTTRNHNTM